MFVRAQLSGCFRRFGVGIPGRMDAPCSELHLAVIKLSKRQLRQLRREEQQAAKKLGPTRSIADQQRFQAVVDLRLKSKSTMETHDMSTHMQGGR